jgi:protein-disulfide isomerase
MTKQQTPHQFRGLEVDPGRDHIQGPANAPVTLTEYGDYQCPYCGEAYSIVKQLQQKFGNNLRFVFRNFPLAQIHAHAEVAAEAAEAAGAQNKFWEMHDYLYEHQDKLAAPQLIAAAKPLGLDVERFTDDLNQHAYAERVREDFLSGVRAGVNGTPTFFINGVRHDGAWDLDSLSEAINAQLKKRNAA